jgi:hypothetical protein
MQLGDSVKMLQSIFDLIEQAFGNRPSENCFACTILCCHGRYCVLGPEVVVSASLAFSQKIYAVNGSRLRQQGMHT